MGDTAPQRDAASPDALSPVENELPDGAIEEDRYRVGYLPIDEA